MFSKVEQYKDIAMREISFDQDVLACGGPRALNVER